MLKLYHHFLSQPSRALYIFLKINKIPFESCVVDLGKGEHLTDEFKQNYSRFQKVPFIHDGNFKLAESVAILRYLAREHNVAENWYPKDSKKQAIVDEYLEWQHNNIRAHCALFFFETSLLPQMTGEKPSERRVEKLKTTMIDTLDKFEELFLENSNYVAGDKISAADILAACEIEQPRIANYEPREGRPKLTAWLDRVRNDCNPFYDEAHTLLNKIVKKGTMGKAKL